MNAADDDADEENGAAGKGRPGRPRMKSCWLRGSRSCPTSSANTIKTPLTS